MAAWPGRVRPPTPTGVSAALKPLLLGVCIGGACGGDRATQAETAAPELPPTNATLTLTEIDRYGWASLADSGRAMTDLERRSLGGILARPVGATEGSDGSVYVLDRDFRKIVVFNRDGTLRRVIVGGYGEGPGEFVDPRGLSLTETGALIVGDQELHRLTAFDSGGKVLWSRRIPGPPPLSIVAANGLVYVLVLYPSPRRMAIVVTDSAGFVTDSLYRPSDAEYRLAYAGSVGAIGRGMQGGLLFAHASPGQWTDLNTGSKLGVELVPEMMPATVRSDGYMVDYTPAVTYGIGQLPDSSILLYYFVHDPAAAASGRFIGATQLANFDALGHPVAFRTLDGIGSKVFSVSRDSMDVFLARDDPFPCIVRYRVALGNANNDPGPRLP